ncbi:M56 family metallopeptidase [Sorangium sp. So ce1667]
MHALDLLGGGLVLGWIALPLLLRLGRTRTEENPALAYRNLLLSLLLATALIALPWIRTCLPRTMAHAAPLQVLAVETPTFGVRAHSFAVSPFGLLAIAWAAAFAIAGARAAVVWVRLRRLLARSAPAPEALQRLVDASAVAIGAPRPRLFISGDVENPFSAGCLSPVIVLPAALDLSLESINLELVIRHELAHVRRRDPLTNAISRACAAIFTLHPSMPGLLKEMTMAREAAVDAEVAPLAPHAYATLLVEMASRVRFGKKLAHVSMDDTALVRRIAMLTNETQTRKRSSTALFLGAAAIIAASLLAPRVFADRGLVGSPDQAEALDQGPGRENWIRACYDEASKEKADLKFDTVAHFTLDDTWIVTSASVPTPASPTFEQCMEQMAIGKTIPPPDAPPPLKDGKLTIAVRLNLGPGVWGEGG